MQRANRRYEFRIHRFVKERIRSPCREYETARQDVCGVDQKTCPLKFPYNHGAIRLEAYKLAAVLIVARRAGFIKTHLIQRPPSGTVSRHVAPDDQSEAC